MNRSEVNAAIALLRGDIFRDYCGSWEAAGELFDEMLRRDDVSIRQCRDKERAGLVNVWWCRGTFPAAGQATEAIARAWLATHR